MTDIVFTRTMIGCLVVLALFGAFIVGDKKGRRDKNAEWRQELCAEGIKSQCDAGPSPSPSPPSWVIDCRNGQSWQFSSGDARDFMPELAKCPYAVILKCDSPPTCAYAPIFVPYTVHGQIIQPIAPWELKELKNAPMSR